jgi:diketogulonate reductase-like aldo/keto reductase
MIPDFLYGTAWKEDRTAALTELALRTGFRGVDTANQRRHYFEAGVGEGLAAAYRAGVVSRADLFLQTKFTYQPGQDHRLPYDPAADLSTQVAQSLASSLDHLGTDHVDSYVLHGPASGHGWTPGDAEVWAAMARERDAGRTRLLGVSNVSLRHLQEMAASGAEAPAFVQNRCFARVGWDRAVRAFCAKGKIVYQAFSLLTANPEVLRHPLIAGIAARGKATPAQVVFRFAQAIGMVPLTGTTDVEHMRQDLESRALTLTPDEVQAVESVAASRGAGGGC